MQDIILDPTKLLTAALYGQVIQSMVVITIATVSSLLQQKPEEKPQASLSASAQEGVEKIASATKRDCHWPTVRSCTADGFSIHSRSMTRLKRSDQPVNSDKDGDSGINCQRTM
jgi:hypothetical protein